MQLNDALSEAISPADTYVFLKLWDWSTLAYVLPERLVWEAIVIYSF